MAESARAGGRGETRSRAKGPVLPEIPPSPFRAPSLGLLMSVLAVGLVLFGLVAADVHFDGRLTAIDLLVGEWVNVHVPSGAQRFFADVLAWPGDDPVIFPILALGATAVIALGRWRTGVLMLMSGFVAGGAVWTLKGFFGETRPFVHFGAEASPGLSHSFPSGHTTDTTVIAGLLVYFLAYTYVSRSRRDPRPLVVPLTLLWAAVSLFMGLFRVLGGVHWPTDVIAGWALGTAWLAVTIVVHEIWVRPFEQLARGRRPLNEAVL